MPVCITIIILSTSTTILLHVEMIAQSHKNFGTFYVKFLKSHSIPPFHSTVPVQRLYTTSYLCVVTVVKRLWHRQLRLAACMNPPEASAPVVLFLCSAFSYIVVNG